MVVEPHSPPLLMETRYEREQLTLPRNCRSIVRRSPKLSLLAHARSNKAREQCRSGRGSAMADPPGDICSRCFCSERTRQIKA
jgi:hypothetical protein